MGDSPSVPTVPDPGAVAAKQQGFNVDAGTGSQAGSMVNQVNPWGSLTYDQQTDANGNPVTGPGGVPLYNATTKLSAPQQSIFDTLQGTQKIAGTQGQGLLRNANYDAQDPTKVIGDATTGNTSAIMKHELDYLSPFFNPQIAQEDTKLKNQGLSENSPAYQQAMNALRQSQGQTVSGFLAQAEPEAYKQAYQNYMTPLTMSNQLMGMSQPGNVNANLAPAPGLSITPANYTGAVADANAANLAAFTAKTKANSDMLTNAFRIPSTILGGLAAGPAGAAMASSMFGPKTA